MLTGGLPLLCLEQVLPDDRLGRLGQVVPAGFDQPVAPGIVGSRHGSTGVVWGLYRCQDKLNSSAALLTSGVLFQPFQQGRSKLDCSTDVVSVACLSLVNGMQP